MNLCVHAQSPLTLCDPMVYSPPRSSVHGISQARINADKPLERRHSKIIYRNIQSYIGSWVLAENQPGVKILGTYLFEGSVCVYCQNF